MFRTASPVREWRLHIGAHKTATTHLQALLAACGPDLATRGIDAPRTEDLRELLTPLVGRTFLPSRFWRAAQGTPLMGLALRRGLRPTLTGLPKVVASEENLLGTTAGLLAPRPYPDLDRRMGIVASLRHGADLHLYLSIRSFDRVLPGAYATTLRFPWEMPRPMGAVRAGVRSSPPSWVDLVERIRAAAPGVSLRVWRQEDYARDPAPFLAALSGVDLPSLPDLPPPAETLTPSAEAVAEAEAAIAAGLDPGAHNARIEAIYAAAPAGPEHPRYMPFDAEEQAILKARYAADIDRLRQDFPGVLIEAPEPAPLAAPDRRTSHEGRR